LQSSSNDAHSEDTAYQATAEHAEDTTSETEKPPHGKKRKVSRKDAGSRQTTVKKVNRIRGMLKNVKEMPVDILFEVRYSRISCQPP
jgi:hypothetical protein